MKDCIGVNNIIKGETWSSDWLTYLHTCREESNAAKDQALQVGMVNLLRYLQAPRAGILNPKTMKPQMSMCPNP